MLTKCALCGGKVVQKKTEKMIKAGNDVILVTQIPAEVCTNCNESYFTPEVVKRLQQLRHDLRKKETIAKLETIGHTYKMPLTAEA